MRHHFIIAEFCTLCIHNVYRSLTRQNQACELCRLVFAWMPHMGKPAFYTLGNISRKKFHFKIKFKHAAVSFSDKVYGEACCGGTKKWNIMFFHVDHLPTIVVWHS